MHPILVEIGPITIRTYGFLLALGVLSAILLIHYFSKKENLVNPETLSNFIFYTIIVGLLGAKLFLFITEIKYYIAHPSAIKYMLTSAGTFYGGLICGSLFAAWYIRKHKLNFKIIADMVGPAVALAHFFGRLGCFFAGCCFGRGAEGCAIAVEYTNTDASTGVPFNTPLYPTQVVESILNLLNFVVLFLLYKKRKFQGQIFAIYIFNYSIIRFFIEFFRGDDDRGYVFGSMNEPFTSLSVPQLISLMGIVIAVIMYRVFKKQSLKKETVQA